MLVSPLHAFQPRARRQEGIEKRVEKEMGDTIEGKMGEIIGEGGMGRFRWGPFLHTNLFRAPQGYRDERMDWKDGSDYSDGEPRHETASSSAVPGEKKIGAKRMSSFVRLGRRFEE